MAMRPLRYRGPHVVAEASSLNISWLHTKYANGQAIISAKCHCRSIHDPQMVLEELIISYVLEEFCIREPDWVPIVDAIYLGRLEQCLPSKFHGA